MLNNQNTRAGNIRQFEIFSSMNEGESIDLRAGITDLSYYEDILKNTVTLTIQVAEAGLGGNRGIVDHLPIRGGEKAHIVFVDADGGERKFVGDSGLYVNRVRNLTKGTQVDTYNIDFCSREFLANEQCRVVKRYDGKISENVKKILTETLSGDTGLMVPASKINDDNFDETLIDYNFIGNEKKPLYTCTWLASKSVPVGSDSAGFLFYETHDGFNFRSIDTMFEGE